jgi:hypothetical protein
MTKKRREYWEPKNNSFVSSNTAEDWAMKKVFSKKLEIVRPMRRAGVKFIAGTDLANPYFFQDSACMTSSVLSLGLDCKRLNQHTVDKFYEIVSRQYEKRAMILTSNKSFGDGESGYRILFWP